jgi:HlyD family secretion protein
MTKRHNGFLRALGTLFVLFLVSVGAYLFLQKSQPEEEDTGNVYFPVARGPLRISVTESGTVKPRDQVIIKNELEGRSTILYLIPEGKRVKKGELLVELDTSSLLDQKVDQEIRVQNAEASYLQSRESLEVAKNQAQADLDKGELSLRFAKEDLKKYMEGDYPNKKSDLEGRIALCEEDVQRTADKLKWSEALFEEKYISETEVKGDRLAAKKAKLDFELAKSNLELLEEYTYKRQIDQLTSDVKQAGMALERTKRKVTADIVQAETNLRARESEFRRQKDKLDKIVEQISKAKIVAPMEGSVVYATSAEFSWRGNVEPLDEGQEVRERQELIHLPTANTFMAEVNIHEASLKKIYVGLPVRLKVDALPGMTFNGSVAKIAPLPDARSMFMNPDLKVYKTDINIDDGGDVLRTGMSCQVEIVIEQHADTLYIPVQCVNRIGGTPVVYVHEGGQDTMREIKIGLDNNTMVRVLDGLKEGEQVLLNPPLSEAGAELPGEEMEKMEIPDRPAPGTGGADRPRPGGGGAPAGKDAADAGNGAGNGAKPGGEGRGNLTPEQRQAMRERFEKMTPEEREKARAQRRPRPAGGEGPGAPAGKGGGE